MKRGGEGRGRQGQEVFSVRSCAFPPHFHVKFIYFHL